MSVRSRSGSMDAARGRTGSLERGRNRPNSAERERQSVRTARSSIIDNPIQRAPDVRSDKNKYITELITFLQKWEIDSPERFTVKTLQCPTSKVFLEIFNFFLEYIMPGHTLSNRYEEEIPNILKDLGYPHSIKKSAVLSIAPHSWPQLLHALVWLSRGLAEMDDYSCPDSEFNTYCMDVCNNPGQQDQFIREMRSRTLDEYEQRLLSLKEQHSSHKRKLDDIQNRDNGDPNAMFATIEKLQSDNSNIERFIENTKKYLEPKDMIIAEIAATQRNLNALLVEKTHRVQQLEEVYSQRSQEMTNEERQEMKSQMTQCVEERRQLNTVIEDTDKKKLDLEIKLSKTLRDVDELCRKFNNLTHDLMDSSIAEDLQLESSKNATEKVNTVIKPYLNKMNDKLIHDEVLLEKQSYRDKLSTDLKKVKSELDTMREKFRISQARDGADVERLTKLSQDLRRQNEELSVTVEACSVECEELITKRDKMQSVHSSNVTKMEKLKEEHKVEEKRRVQKLSVALEQKKKRDMALKKQEITLRGLIKEAECQKVQLQAINDALEAIFPCSNPP